MTLNNYLLAGLLYLSAAPIAIGCGFHKLELQFESMYPGSLSVAVALRNAADSGVIDAAILEAPGKDDDTCYADTVRRLQEFRNTLAALPAAAELPASFSLGYVESDLWTRYSHSDGKIRINIHTDGPAEGEAVVLTGEPVLMDIVAGKLSVDRAIADGMILIDGSESEKTAIRHALKTSSMAQRISKR